MNVHTKNQQFEEENDFKSYRNSKIEHTDYSKCKILFYSYLLDI